MNSLIMDTIEEFIKFHRTQIAEEKERLSALAKENDQQFFDDANGSLQEEPPANTHRHKNISLCDASKDCGPELRAASSTPLNWKKNNANDTKHSHHGDDRHSQTHSTETVLEASVGAACSSQADSFSASEALPNVEDAVESKEAMHQRHGQFSSSYLDTALTAKAASFLGHAEYDNKRKYLKGQTDYCTNQGATVQPRLSATAAVAVSTKAVQTDIQNIHCRLVQCDLHSHSPAEKDLNSSCGGTSSVGVVHGSGSASTSTTTDRDPKQNDDTPDSSMETKPKSILSNRRTGSRPPSNQNSMLFGRDQGTSFLDGFSCQDRNEELQRERIKRESYERELRMQIEENRRLQALRDEQERRQQEAENRRLEQQLAKMQEEQRLIDEERRIRRDEQLHMRRHSEELQRRQLDAMYPSSSTGIRLRKHHTDSDGALLQTGSSVSNYSPPIVRRSYYTEPRYSSTRNSMARAPYMLHSPTTSLHGRANATFTSSRQHNYGGTDWPLSTSGAGNGRFSRYDSLNSLRTAGSGMAVPYDALGSRFETMSIQDGMGGGSSSYSQRRHSASHYDSSAPSSPKMGRRSNSGRQLQFVDNYDSLPIPLLKSHSGVAKELKNSIPFSSKHSYASEALRKLEDKWQIPAVQRNIVNYNASSSSSGLAGSSAADRSVLTQLGAIRMQLQQEQLRMDEHLRKRNYTSQSKAVNYH